MRVRAHHTATAALSAALLTGLITGCSPTPIPERPTAECAQIAGHAPRTGVNNLTVADVDAAMAAAHAAGGCEAFIAQYRPILMQGVQAQHDASMTSCLASQNSPGPTECRRLVDAGVSGG